MGAVRIRIRSLLAALQDKKKAVKKIVKNKIEYRKNLFTKKMKEEYTILAPQMSPIHFGLLKDAFGAEGYNLEVLEETKEALNTGLQFVNNDAYYPSILVIGELISALKSGKYNIHKTAVLISQTGGSCRATNYIGFLKKALKDSGFANIPVLSLNSMGYEAQEGFKITFKLAHKVLMAVSYGDILMKLLYHVRPYEKIKGVTNKIFDKWYEDVRENIRNGKLLQFRKNLDNIVKDFSEIAVTAEKKIKVGVVGEILVKFSPFANNYLVDFIESEGGEARTSSLMSFVNYCIYSDKFIQERFHGKLAGIKAKAALAVTGFYTGFVNRALSRCERFKQEDFIGKIADKTSKYISIGHQSGEGWFLLGEMIELIEHGVPNIVCVQPFGCLPNHITGKGMIKKLKEEYSHSNIVSIDYDPAYSEVNQINRIKLMLSVAKKNLLTQNL